jgi:hypothetical protein
MHAINDAITTTAASRSSDIHLPEEFYDTKLGDIVDKIAFEEEYSAFQESYEMRRGDRSAFGRHRREDGLSSREAVPCSREDLGIGPHSQAVPVWIA